MPRRVPFRNPCLSRAATSRTLLLPLLPPPSPGGASRGRDARLAGSEPLPPPRHSSGGEGSPSPASAFALPQQRPGSARDFYGQANSGLLALGERPHTWAPLQPLSPREAAEPQGYSCPGSQSPCPHIVLAPGVYSQRLPRLPGSESPAGAVREGLWEVVGRVPALRRRIAVK